MDNSKARFVIGIDNNTIEFTPSDVDSIPLHISDFSEYVPLIPFITYTDGTVYIVEIKVESYADTFVLNLITPSKESVNASWEVITVE